MEKQATIRDVARAAGVSVATVSRVMCEGEYPVSPLLKQRVKETAQKLGYIPNAAAKSLRKPECKDVGVVIPNISNPFYLQAVLGINEVLAGSGYNMILCNTMNDPQREKQYLKQLAQRQTAGVILSSAREDDATAVEYSNRGLRFVMLDQKIEGVDCPSVNFDTRAGARMATEYLITMGHRRIALASLPLVRWTRTQMLQGYQDALAAAGIPYEESFVYIGGDGRNADHQVQEIDVGRQIAEAFAQDGCPATAILCVNDMLAIGLMGSLMKRGIRIPEDVSVVGFDDIPLASAYTPALTTVRYPALDTGRLAAMVLLNPMMNTSVSMPLTLNLTPQLILRDTVRSV